jgi:hypothetical protein
MDSAVNMGGAGCREGCDRWVDSDARVAATCVGDADLEVP